jgi:hypothetical protein
LEDDGAGGRQLVIRAEDGEELLTRSQIPPRRHSVTMCASCSAIRAQGSLASSASRVSSKRNLVVDRVGEVYASPTIIAINRGVL